MADGQKEKRDKRSQLKGKLRPLMPRRLHGSTLYVRTPGLKITWYCLRSRHICDHLFYTEEGVFTVYFIKCSLNKGAADNATISP